MVDLKKYRDVFSKGVVISLAPGILKGVLLELFRERAVTIEEVIAWVEKDENLWASVSAKNKAMMKNLATRLGDLGWLNVNWAIGAIRETRPALASLFLGWDEGKNWLERQLEVIKSELQT